VIVRVWAVKNIAGDDTQLARDVKHGRPGTRTPNAVRRYRLSKTAPDPAGCPPRRCTVESNHSPEATVLQTAEG